MDVITTHVNADFDCLGAMIGAKKLYPDAVMVFPGAQEKNLRDFLLHSAGYAFDFKRIKDVDFKEVKRLILVDVRQRGRIGPFAELLERSDVEVHIYDHHPSDQADVRGDLEVIRPVGATVTVLSHLFMEQGIVLTGDEATLMMLGLYEDTGNLLFDSTTVEDFQAASFLRSQGACLNTVSDFMVQELSADQVALLHHLINSQTILNVNGVNICLAHATSPEFVGELAVLTHKLRDMGNHNALIVVVRMGDRIFMVGRSRSPEVHMGHIFNEFGGGGHSFAASGTVRDMTLVQVMDQLPNVLREHVKPRLNASHLMAFPVKSVAMEESIDEARKLLTRYDINAMPVMDHEQVVGIITRQMVDKAVHHGLGGVPVKEYMNGEFATVTPETSVEVLQEIIVDHHQRFVPVVDHGRLVGVVTRTGLFQHMVTGVRTARRPSLTSDRAEGLSLKKNHVARLLREQLPRRVSELLEALGRAADEMGCMAYAVGGFVRDLFLRHPNLDVDIVVEGDGIAFARHFAAQCECRVRTHSKFGTAVIIFPDNFKVDVASTRTEYYHEPAALPTVEHVEHAPIKVDLYRRDFTINTLAVALNASNFGELVDPFGAMRDLKDKVLRVLHNLSFVEDPTRVFRAVRFEQRLGFHLGAQTRNLLRSAVQMGFLNRVAGPRLYNELVIMLKEPNPFGAVERMSRYGFLKCVHPALGLGVKTRKALESAPRAINWFELLYTDEAVESWKVYFLCLATEMDDDAMKGICSRLGVPPRLAVLFCEERAEGHRALRVMHRLHREKETTLPSELYHALSPFSTEMLLYLVARADNEHIRRRISFFFTRLRKISTHLNGFDLKALGIAPGPVYKDILAVLLDERLNGNVVTREDEIDLVRTRFLQSA